MMDNVLAGLRAAGEATRLRLLYVLSRGEFNVTELTQILRQSQPRLSRHLKLMVDAKLLERYREGSWVLFRIADAGPLAQLARAIVEQMPDPSEEPVLASDCKELEAVLQRRAEAAKTYFSANAQNWDKIRSLHVADDLVEAAMLEMATGIKPKMFIDLGTGTGEVLNLLGPRATNAMGIDLNKEMLAIARARTEAAGHRHIQVRHGDLFALPLEDRMADLVTLHQVLHYLDDYTGALFEAGRILAPGGHLLIVDFAPHELEFLREDHAHRRLGFSDGQIQNALKKAGLKLLKSQRLEPPARTAEQMLTVSLWLAQKPLS